MSAFQRLQEVFPFLGALRSLRLLLGHGVRWHPSAIYMGSSGRCALGRGSAIGAMSKLEILGAGNIVIGASAWLSDNVLVSTGKCIQIGARTTLQRGTSVYGDVRIGSDCLFAGNVYLSSETHEFRAKPELPIRRQDELIRNGALPTAGKSGPVAVGDDCWLAQNVVVLPGVTIGKGAIVGANSVVTAVVRPYQVVAGAPAKVVAVRLDWQPKRAVSLGDAGSYPYFETSGSHSTVDRLGGITLAGGDWARIALANGSASARVRMGIHGSGILEAGGECHPLDTGHHELLVPCAQDRVPFGNAEVSLAFRATSPGSKVVLHEISCD